MSQDQSEHRTLWTRLVHAVLPAPDPNRMVPIATVRRSSVPLLEGSLADAELRAIVRQTGFGVGADDRFEVLVAARDAKVAHEVVSGY